MLAGEPRRLKWWPRGDLRSPRRFKRPLRRYLRFGAVARPTSAALAIARETGGRLCCLPSVARTGVIDGTCTRYDVLHRHAAICFAFDHHGGPGRIRTGRDSLRRAALVH